MTSPGRRSLLVTAGTVAVLVGLVATFPAHLALAWFAPPQVQAWGVEGSVWRGRAAEVAVDGGSLGALSWESQPARLLLLRAAWDLELRPADGYARARVEVSPDGGRLTITDLDASLELAALPTSIAPGGLAGQVRASLTRLVLDRGWPVEISGRATAANLKLPQVIMPLGPFEFQFPERSDWPQAEIRSQGGPLELDGRVELPARGQWHFSADLAPGENAPRELVQGLDFAAENLGNGRWRFTMSGEP